MNAYASPDWGIITWPDEKDMANIFIQACGVISKVEDEKPCHIRWKRAMVLPYAPVPAIREEG